MSLCLFKLNVSMSRNLSLSLEWNDKHIQDACVQLLNVSPMSRTRVVPCVLQCKLQRIMQCSLVGAFAHTHGRAAQFGYLGSHTQLCMALGVEYCRCTVATFIYLHLPLP